MILSLSQFLWEITVSGGEVYSESDILKYVTDNYYHIGTLKYQIDCDALEDHLRKIMLRLRGHPVRFREQDCILR